MNFPRISIVTPNYDGGKYLEDTILSVLDQFYPNLEYIVIDGNSKDGSIDIIKKYENRLTYWISEPDKGMYHAIQKGFEKSTGEIMAWINSDDMYHRKSLFTVAEIFSSYKEIEWLQGAGTSFDESGRTVYCTTGRSFTKFDFYNRDYKWIQQESVFWRRSLWDKAGSALNTNLKYAGDFDLWLRFFKHSRLYVADILIGGFRWQSSGQITLDHFKDYMSEVEKTIDSNVLDNSEIEVLKKLNQAKKLDSLMKKLKVFKTGYFVNRVKSRYFPKPAKVFFDRSLMKFISTQP
jgi:glycosyltransferase involved in cell wall biosynthesis